MSIPNICNFTKIATRIGHSLGLMKDGFCYTWGWNKYGQCGNGTTTDVPIPTLLPFLEKVVDVAAGYYHSLFCTESGTVYSSGRNNTGQLGRGWDAKETTLAEVAIPETIVKVFAGLYDSFAISKSGKFYIWGDNNLEELNNHNTTKPYPVQFSFAIRDISSEYKFTNILTYDGYIYNWGINNAGQMGDGTQKDHHVPQKIPTLSQIQKIVSGAAYSLALTKDGTVYSWGNNDYGQIGNGSTDDQLVPVQVLLPGKATDVATSGYTSYVKLEDGRVFAFGTNDDLEIGSKYQEEFTTTPVEVHYTDENLLYLPFKITGYSLGYGKITDIGNAHIVSIPERPALQFHLPLIARLKLLFQFLVIVCPSFDSKWSIEQYIICIVDFLRLHVFRFLPKRSTPPQKNTRPSSSFT